MLFRVLVSFPGGTEDPEDAGNMIETALRETLEEIGLDRSRIQVLGPFDEAMSINGLHVTPVLAFCGEYDPKFLKPNKDEIADIFVVTIADLTSPGARIDEQLKRGKVARFIKSPYPVRLIWNLMSVLISLLTRFWLTDMGDDRLSDRFGPEKALNRNSLSSAASANTYYICHIHTACGELRQETTVRRQLPNQRYHMSKLSSMQKPVF